jgi:hypothetical protein
MWQGARDQHGVHHVRASVSDLVAVGLMVPLSLSSSLFHQSPTAQAECRVGLWLTCGDALVAVVQVVRVVVTATVRAVAAAAAGTAYVVSRRCGITIVIIIVVVVRATTW